MRMSSGAKAPPKLSVICGNKDWMGKATFANWLEVFPLSLSRFPWFGAVVKASVRRAEKCRKAIAKARRRGEGGASTIYMLSGELKISSKEITSRQLLEVALHDGMLTWPVYSPPLLLSALLSGRRKRSFECWNLALNFYDIHPYSLPRKELGDVLGRVFISSSIATVVIYLD